MVNAYITHLSHDCFSAVVDKLTMEIETIVTHMLTNRPRFIRTCNWSNLMSHYRPKIECWNELLRSHTQELENTVKATDIIVDIVMGERKLQLLRSTGNSASQRIT